MKVDGRAKDLAVAFAITFAWPFVASFIIFMTSDEYLQVSGKEAFYGRNFAYFVFSIFSILTIALVQWSTENYFSIKARILACIILSILIFYVMTGPFKIDPYTLSEWLYSQIGFWIFMIIQSVMFSVVYDWLRKTR